MVERDGKATKGKGCDIGYALAASSCEGAHSVDACTVAALRCNHRFCGSKPQLLLAGQLVFSGSVARRVASPSGSPSLLRTGQHYLDRSFRPSTLATLNPPDPKSCDRGHKSSEKLWIYSEQISPGAGEHQPSTTGRPAPLQKGTRSEEHTSEL